MRPQAQSSGQGPRRLGGQQAPQRPSSAQRRYQRSHRGRQRNWLGYGAVGVVVVVIVVLVALKVTGSSSPGADTAGRHPVAAPAAVVSALTSVPTSTFNSVGTGAVPVPFTVTKNQPSLTSGGLPRFVYEGAEYCPYCAMMRWSLVAALARFGTFHGLKETTSSADYAPIPTLSFVGSTYTSKYVVFTPYEQQDRAGAALQTVPSDVLSLVLKYDGNGSSPARPFNTGSTSGIPFLDVGNKYVSQGVPRTFLGATVTALAGVGTGRMISIADAISNPNTAFGNVIAAKNFVAEANYITAAICSLNGGKPSAVCSTPGVQKALAAMKKVKAVS